MIISIASGKGGTGKTTVATNLAASLDKEVQFLDCDVEEPNGHLFIQPKITEKKTIYTMVPEVNHDLCNLNRNCVDICRFAAITAIGDEILTFPGMCHSCGGCMVVCTQNAITEGKRELGEIEQGRKNHIHFIHGRLKIGEAMSPPLIKKVRSYIQPDMISIIDAPPGTSCPVIMAMKDVNFVLLVTEPTPFGLHDLKLAVGAVQLLDIPCGLVINRADIGNDSVYQYAKENDIPILMEIPFDRGIAQTYSHGKLIVDEDDHWRLKFQTLYSCIEEIVSTGRIENN